MPTKKKNGGKWVKCDRCSGRGSISMNPVGRVLAGLMTAGISEITGTSSTCTKCNGKGSVFLKYGNHYI